MFYLFSHVSEVLVNAPKEVASVFLLPADTVVTSRLCTRYPRLYPSPPSTDDIIEGGVVSGVGTVYSLYLDHVFDGFNMASVVCLLNYLHIQLVSKQATLHTVHSTSLHFTNDWHSCTSSKISIAVP